MDTRLGSRIIKEDGLDEPHVIMTRTPSSVVLVRLEDVLKTAEASEDVVLVRGTTLEIPGSLTDLIPPSDFPEGSVTYFENVGGGKLRSYFCQITEEGKKAIEKALGRTIHNLS